MAGWSVLVNIIGVMLTYFYVPPGTAGWSPLLSLIPIGIFNLLALIPAAGRLADAFYDPFIGQLSNEDFMEYGEGTHRTSRRSRGSRHARPS